MFYKILVSPQEKRCRIITYEHSIQVASGVAEQLKTWNLRNLGNIRKLCKFPGIIA